jgi:hypothetical protein
MMDRSIGGILRSTRSRPKVEPEFVADVVRFNKELGRLRKEVARLDKNAETALSAAASAKEELDKALNGFTAPELIVDRMRDARAYLVEVLEALGGE